MTTPEPIALRLVPMTEHYARQIATWRYPPPYDWYNIDSASAEQDMRDVFLNPAYHYRAVLDLRDELIAFRCFGPDAQVRGGDYHAAALDMGGGLRPDLTGQRRGPAVLLAAIAWARIQFAPPAFRTTVAAWNQRALRACASVGYKPVQRFSDPAGAEFVVLLRPA